MKTATYHSNILGLKLVTSLRGMLFMVSVITLYVGQKGISFAEFMQVQTIFMVVLIAATPLLSSWADRTGYKRAILMGTALWVTGNLTLWQSTGFWTFVLAETQFALACALFGPAGDALLFTSLKATGHQNRHHKVLNNQQVWADMAIAVSMGASGWLYQWYPDAPVLASCLSAGLAFALTFGFLKEPEIPHGHARNTTSYRAIWKGTWNDITHPKTRWVVILPGLVSGTTLLLFWSFQPKLTSNGVSASLLGSLLMGAFILRGGYAKASPWVRSKLGTRGTLTASIIMLSGGVLSMGLLPWEWALPGYTLGSACSYVLATSLGKDLLQHRVDGPHRATAMAGFAMVERLMGIATLTAASYLQPGLGLETTLLIVGGLSTLLATLSLTKLTT